MRNFIICTHPQIRQVKSRGMRWAGQGGGEKGERDFGGRARRKETTWKTKV
jgi:hypothetical protein